MRITLLKRFLLGAPMPLAFAACWIVSLLDGASRAAAHGERFDEVSTRALVGESPNERGG